MKVLFIPLLCLGSLCAQVTSPQKPKPGLPNIPADKVVVGFDDGTSMTMGQLRQLLNIISPQQQQQALTDLPGFLDQWALMRKLAHMAEEAKLDQQSPAKDQLAYDRMNVLAQSQINNQYNSGMIEEGDLEKYYEAHKASYLQVKTDAIYISFSNAAASQTASDGKKVLSRDEAQAKIANLLAEVRKGADFKKLARENSDDETSRAKDGFFGTLSPSDNIPEAIKAALFQLKSGETTDVIAQPNGFYLFRAEDVTYKPFNDVRDQIYQEYRQNRFRSWMDGIRSETKAHVLDPALTGGSSK